MGCLLMSKSLVSIIIPTYNYGHFVADAVQSALNQTYSPCEVIVVDDGSTDNTSDVLRQFEGRVQVIRKVNAGLSAARNTGLQVARGDYIAILDSDDVWFPEKIERQMTIFAVHSDLGIVSCGAWQVDNNLKTIQPLEYKDYADPAELRRRLSHKNIVSGGSSALIKKECFDKVGGFDETLRSAEDWDMWLRISQYYGIRIVEEPLVKIRAGSENMSSVKNAARMLENELWVIEKQADQNSWFRKNRELRNSALSYRHFCAAWAYWRGLETQQAWIHIWKSFLCSPLSFFNRQQGGLLARMIVGTLLRVHIPVNGLTRPFFSTVYRAHVFFRESWIVFIKFFYYEPLFRSQCSSVGLGLWMEQLPYLVGNGRLVIGRGVRLSGKPSFAFSRKIHSDPELVIGDHTFIGHDVRFAVAQRITIGKHCYIAGGTSFADNDGHPLNAATRRANQPPQAVDVRPVTVGDDVWIGREAVILKGVTIGDRAVIGTRAVVTKDVAADTIVAGNPARELRKIRE